MKRIALLLLTIVAFAATPARAEVEISFDFFHESLSPYGDWCDVEGYGPVWHPTGMDEEWAPYTDGYWTYTDAGWTWVSYEDFGGITYHYGRWLMLDDYGWCWVPDYEWGPAWVSWRKNDDYVGWAPLPPEARWERESGFGTWVDVSFDIGPGYFRFCSWRDFSAPVIRHVCVPRSRNVVIISNTVNITNISYRDDYDCVYNGGFDYDYVAPRVARPVPALKLVRNKTTNIFVNGNKGNVFINSPRGNALVVAAPAVAKTNYNVLTKKLPTKRSFEKSHVSRGWKGLDKPEDRDRLLVKMREETRGKTRENAPARKPETASFAVLPKKADFEVRPPTLIAPRREDGDRDKKPGAVADRSDRGPEPRETDKPDRGGLRPNGDEKPKDTAPIAVRDTEDMRKGGKPGGKKGETSISEIPPQAPVAPGGGGEGLSRNGGRENGGGSKGNDAAREQAREQAMQKERERAGKAQAEAARKDLEKQQRSAEAAEKERSKAAEKEAERRAKAQRDEDAKARAIAERNAAAERERSKEMQRQQAAADSQRRQAEENDRRARDAAKQRGEEQARQRAIDSQRKQAEENNRRAGEAARQRSAEQARERAQEQMRRQAEDQNRRRAAEAAQQRAAEQAAARQRAQRPQPSQIRPPAFTPPQAVPQGGDKERGKGKDKDKRR